MKVSLSESYSLKFYCCSFSWQNKVMWYKTETLCFLRAGQWKLSRHLRSLSRQLHSSKSGSLFVLGKIPVRDSSRTTRCKFTTTKRKTQSNVIVKDCKCAPLETEIRYVFILYCWQKGRRNKVDVSQDGVWEVRVDKMAPSASRLLFRSPEERLHDDWATSGKWILKISGKRS